jgi:hypothetical protein
VFNICSQKNFYKPWVAFAQAIFLGRATSLD